MKPLLAILLVSIVLSGCAQRLIGGPLGALTLADAARSQQMVTVGTPGIFAPGDPIGACLGDFSSKLKTLQGMAAVPGPKAAISEAVMVYGIGQALDRLDPACAKLIIRLMAAPLPKL